MEYMDVIRVYFYVGGTGTDFSQSGFSNWQGNWRHIHEFPVKNTKVKTGNHLGIIGM